MPIAYSFAAMEFQMSCELAERPIVTDRRRKSAIDEETDGVTVIMSEIPMLAAVRSTILLGVTD